MTLTPKLLIKWVVAIAVCVLIIVAAVNVLEEEVAQDAHTETPAQTEELKHILVEETEPILEKQLEVLLEEGG